MVEVKVRNYVFIYSFTNVRVNSHGEVSCPQFHDNTTSPYFYINTIFLLSITSLQIGHSSTPSEHTPQQTKWPQGKKRTLRFSAKHTVQVSASSRASRVREMTSFSFLTFLRVWLKVA